MTPVGRIRGDSGSSVMVSGNSKFPLAGPSDLEDDAHQRKLNRVSRRLTLCFQSALIGTSAVRSAAEIALLVLFPPTELTTSFTIPSIRS
jgi:hypothetical protein